MSAGLSGTRRVSRATMSHRISGNNMSDNYMSDVGMPGRISSVRVSVIRRVRGRAVPRARYEFAMSTPVQIQPWQMKQSEVDS